MVLFFFLIIYSILLVFFCFSITKLNNEHFYNQSKSQEALENPFVFLPSNDSFKDINEDTMEMNANEVPDKYSEKLHPVLLGNNSYGFDMSSIPQPLNDLFKTFKEKNKQLNESDAMLFNRFMVPFLWKTCVNLIETFEKLNKDIETNNITLKNTVPQIKQLNEAIQELKIQ